MKRKSYSVKYDDCTYIDVHSNDGMNRQNNDIGLNQSTNLLFMTYNVQTKNNDDDNNNDQLYDHAL